MKLFYLKREIGGYLTKLLDDYELITKQQPLFEKSANNNDHYAIQDNFLCFWFRFIYRYNYMIEVEVFHLFQGNGTIRGICPLLSWAKYQ